MKLSSDSPWYNPTLILYTKKSTGNKVKTCGEAKVPSLTMMSIGRKQLLLDTLILKIVERGELILNTLEKCTMI